MPCPCRHRQGADLFEPAATAPAANASGSLHHPLLSGLHLLDGCNAAAKVPTCHGMPPLMP
jgi:hypothetical protein